MSKKAEQIIKEVNATTSLEGMPLSDFDIELISVVEGEVAQQIPGPYFPMTGTKEGLTLTTQDHLPKLGEYRLDGDIPEIINSVENIIEKNENELEISWI